jgi:hypothetical protein
MGSIIQGGVDLPLVAHYTLSGASATGLTVTVNALRLRAGSWSEVVTAGAATEVGRGLYAYTVDDALVAAGDIFAYVFVTAGSVDQADLAGLSAVEANYTATRAGYLDAAISTRAVPADVPAASVVADAVWDELLSGHASTGSAGAALSAADAPTVAEIAAGLRSAALVVPPSTLTGRVQIVKGDTYSAALDRAIQWSAGALTDLSGGTGAAYVKNDAGAWESVGSVTVAGDPQTVSWALTAAQSATLDAGIREYRIEFDMGSGAQITVAMGLADVIEGTD